MLFRSLLARLPQGAALGAPRLPQRSGTRVRLACRGLAQSHQFVTSPEKIISRLSFSHIREIMTEKEPLGRFFYETECIRGCWSVKELRRQIATNLYFRSGISKNPQLLLDNIGKQPGNDLMDIRQPFTFEFLGLDAKEAYSERDLENSLLAHLEEFLLSRMPACCNRGNAG